MMFHYSSFVMYTDFNHWSRSPILTVQDRQSVLHLQTHKCTSLALQTVVQTEFTGFIPMGSRWMLGVLTIVGAVHFWYYTLTSHFIRYSLLVLGWTPFFLQNCLNSLWHRFNKALKTFHRGFGPYWHDSIMQLLQICCLHIHDVNLPFHHIPQRCSIGLRFWDCGGHWSTVNSLSCSRNQFEMIWALWHALSWWK